ncbi:hypothetical protein HDU67_007381, partial [Dinochytrium kinnereticum]
MSLQVSVTWLANRINVLEKTGEKLRSLVEDTAENQKFSDSMMVHRCMILQREIGQLRQSQFEKDEQIGMLIQLILQYRGQFRDIMSRLEVLEVAHSSAHRRADAPRRTGFGNQGEMRKCQRRKCGLLVRMPGFMMLNMTLLLKLTGMLCKL